MFYLDLNRTDGNIGKYDRATRLRGYEIQEKGKSSKSLLVLWLSWSDALFSDKCTCGLIEPTTLVFALRPSHVVNWSCHPSYLSPPVPLSRANKHENVWIFFLVSCVSRPSRQAGRPGLLSSQDRPPTVFFVLLDGFQAQLRVV